MQRDRAEAGAQQQERGHRHRLVGLTDGDPRDAQVQRHRSGNRRDRGDQERGHPEAGAEDPPSRPGRTQVQRATPFTPRQPCGCDHDQRHDQPREERAFGRWPRPHPTPETETLGRGQEAGDIGTELLDLDNRTRQTQCLVRDVVVPQHRRHHQHRRHEGGQQRRVARHRQPCRHEPHDPESNQDAGEHEVVAARQGLHHQGDRDHDQPHAPHRRHPSMQAEQRNGQPVGRQQLEMRKVIGPEG